MEITYRREGDYLLPNLTAPKPPKIGKYGLMRQTFLREHHNGIYTGMLLTDKLNSHLEDVDRRALEMEDLLVTRLAKAQGVTESLKASDQLRWVGLMNNIQAQAEEIVLAEIVYA